MWRGSCDWRDNARSIQLRKTFPLNNNRSNNNNRRRGRGGNRSQGGNQGNQLNRIDSRARGNASQLLEKFKKMAQDASLNGDRVQAEYYLQFADHYFRVVADGKARMDEQRARRDEERATPDNGNQDSTSDNDGERNARHSPPRNERGEQSNEDPRFADAEQGESGAAGGDSQNDSSKNPFTRRPPRTRAPSTRKSAPRKRDNDAPPENESTGLDPTSLPPAIGVSDGDDDTDKKPAPRKRVRRTRPATDDGGEAFEKAEKAG